MEEELLEQQLPRAVVPGEMVVLPSSAAVVGSGLMLVGGRRASVTRAGVLRARQQDGRVWVSQVAQRRYVPLRGDLVVGVIVERLGENYRVDIRGPAPALLEMTEFDGASRRNRPDLRSGTLIYARVEQDRDLEPWLTCKAPSGTPKRDWVTGQSVFGELVGGYVMDCSQTLARYLLEKRCFVLEELGKQFGFEVASGSNGRVWVNAEDSEHIIIVVSVLRKLDKNPSMDAPTLRALIQEIVKRAGASSKS